MSENSKHDLCQVLGQTLEPNISVELHPRGLVPTLATVGPYSGLQFGFYALFNQIFDPFLSSGRISMSKSVLCGGLAGLCAKTAVFPFDTTKKRLQVQVTVFRESTDLF